MMAADSRPTTDAYSRFMLGAAALRLHDADQLRGLLASVLGVDVHPTGDTIEVGGTRFTAATDPVTKVATLRAETRCEVCGDPLRSLPIQRQYDLAAFYLGRHRDTHEHGWLTGE